MSKKLKKALRRIVVALVIYAVVFIAVHVVSFEQVFGSAAVYIELVLFAIPYLIAGYDVLLKAARNITKGQVFDENFLMSIATLGAFLLVLFPGAEPHFEEGAAVMLFYQIGEFFQSYAVGKTRKSISDMMDIAPDSALVEENGELVEVDPSEVPVGSLVVVRPGDRVPLDGIVESGTSSLDTAALTGESVPREVQEGDEVISGCVNLSGRLVVKTTKEYDQSTVARILELVENASEKKAHTENFVTRFAKYYTPVVTFGALAIALLPPLFLGGGWADWIQRGLTFLVVSCPCALVISVPLSFFGGIGGASRVGILVKGSNYLELLAQCETVAFDKTGTLTNGSFDVVALHPRKGVDPDRILSLAAHAEAYSNHPIAVSIREAYSGVIDKKRIEDVSEQGGHGVEAVIDEKVVRVGNDKLMSEGHIDYHDCELTGTILHVSVDGEYLGHIIIADVLKKDAAQAIKDLKHAGVKKTVMLTGDREEVAAAVAKELGIDEYRAQLLPQDKVAIVEDLLEETSDKGKLAFVGDGINDAPVLMRADVGIAMGAMGSDAAIEAADVVLMDDDPTSIARAIGIARKTLGIVWQNIVFAIGIKFAVLILAALGFANMWMAVFADVGVSLIAILNAMRAMNVKKKQ